MRGDYMKKSRAEFLKFVSATIGSLFVFLLAFPAILAVLRYIMGDRTSEAATIVQAAATTGHSIELALLSAALGAIVLWFAGREKGDSGRKRSRVIEYWGKSFLFAAFCFSIFAFLSPMAPFDNVTGYEWWDEIIKYTTVVTAVAGSAMLLITSLYGMVLIWLQTIKYTNGTN